MFRAVLRQPWFYGFYWWDWRTNPDWGGPDNRDYTPHEKPAETVLTRWYAGMTAARAD